VGTGIRVAGLFGGVGAGIGGLIGTASHSEHWVEVQQPWSAASK
jgi:hypothetical protein